MPEWKIVDGILMEGYGIASGKATDSPYPKGSIEMQIPYFQKLGLDLREFYLGTLNISISPYIFEMKSPEYRFQEVNWILGVVEDFSFSKCFVRYENHWYRGYVYYPHPETKARHFHDQTVVEIISEKIPNISYESLVQVKLNTEEIVLTEMP